MIARLPEQRRLAVVQGFSVKCSLAIRFQDEDFNFNAILPGAASARMSTRISEENGRSAEPESYLCFHPPITRPHVRGIQGTGMKTRHGQKSQDKSQMLPSPA